MGLQETLLRTYFGVYSFVAPTAAAKTGFNVFQKVRKKEIRPREADLYKLANHFKVDSPVGPVDCYQMGEEKNQPVLLVHGWDSNAGSMSKIAFDLIENNYKVYLFNLPGHAFDKSDKTNLLECRHAMTAVLDQLNFGENLSIISHSFGSAVTAFTLANCNQNVDRLIFLTNPNRIEDIFQDFKNYIGLGAKAYEKLVQLTEAKLGASLKEVSVVENLKSVNYNALYLIHDKFDKVLSYKNAEAIHREIPKTHLETFEKIGHYKMLWNDEVLNKCKLFLN